MRYRTRDTGGEVVKRHVFNLLAALSLLLCVLTCVPWVRAYWVADSLYWTDKATNRIDEYGLTCSAGGVEIVHIHKLKVRGYPVSTGNYFSHFNHQLNIRYPYFGSGSTGISFAGFEVFHGTDEVQSVTFPLAAIVLPALVFPGMWIRRDVKHRRRTKTKLCRQCGYDLRATPDRCPECRTVPGNAEG
jgi:4-amino-4-deoxy-L-arabinose transferase-like glycosyltransferase